MYNMQFQSNHGQMLGMKNEQGIVTIGLYSSLN